MKAADCTACEKGKYSLSASRSCSACPVGTYNSLDTGVSECTGCPTGKYAGKTGLTVCTDCAAGKYSGSEAKTSAADCGNCVAIPAHSEKIHREPYTFRTSPY
jgi:hypothetical protein